MSLTDLDSYYGKCIGSLYSQEQSSIDSSLQSNLEEAIKCKVGGAKDFTPLITSVSTRTVEEVRAIAHVIEETKTTSSSDNELELDLFNEDLMCIICNGMDVGARNRLLECTDCHSLYHQECHRPPVTTVDANTTWTCQNCKDASRKLKTTPESSPSHTTSTTGIKPIIKIAPPGLQYQSTASAIFKLAGTKAMATTSVPKSGISTNTKSLMKSGSSGGTTSKGASTSTGSSGNLKSAAVTPNINIITADKRLQIMKKKAAKMHEKRKHLPLEERRRRNEALRELLETLPEHSSDETQYKRKLRSNSGRSI